MSIYTGIVLELIKPLLYVIAGINTQYEISRILLMYPHFGLIETSE